VQHPVPIKPLGGEKADEPLKLYLTKKERKRIRRTAREEREKEKRDKLLMGLIPAPEPKFKLSNFMKMLGDQAVADPSKVEQRVQLQMQQRQLNHEMRNQARKLTPAERKEKKRKKLHEDTSRQVHVAVFRVKDFSDSKHRFKVDVNAQQYNLTGTGNL
jgi:U4/U6 small nuclear ribonucleoprotein PRP3